jgi:NADH dehydrogenase
MAAVARALGLVVRDVVLTADEIRGLTSGLLVSHQTALGHISFLDWLNEHSSTLGGAYANELDRHFRSVGISSAARSRPGWRESA